MRQERIAMISLDLDAVAVDRPSCATTLFEFGCQSGEFLRRQAEPRDDRHRFAFATLSFTANSHNAAGHLPGRSLPAYAFN
jgi:hypothetical protein